MHKIGTEKTSKDGEEGKLVISGWGSGRASCCFLQWWWWWFAGCPVVCPVLSGADVCAAPGVQLKWSVG